MNENEFDQAAVPSADIPDLKKKEKERKKAGAAWGAGKPAPGGWQGAVGGSGQAASRVAASAAARAGGQAAVQAGRSFFSQIVGQFSAAVARFAATMVGKAVLTALAVGVIGAGAVVMMRGGGPAVGGGPDLGGISSNINTKREGRSGLAYAKGQGAGLLAGDPAQRSAEREKGQETEKAPGTEGDGEMPGDQLGREGVEATQGDGDLMENNMAGAKLSTNLGSQFGSKSVFAGNSPKFGAGFDRSKLKALSVSGNKKGTGGRLVARNNMASKNLTMRGLKTSRALGQLRGMSSLNSRIKGQGSTADEANAAAASAQFEATETDGGVPPEGVTTPNPTGGGGGGSACQDGFYPDQSGQCIEIPNEAGINVSPWQAPWDQAMAIIKQAIQMLIIASILYLIFLWLFIIFSAIPDCSDAAIQFVFWAIAVGIAVYFNKVAMDMANQIQKLGDQINDAKGEPMGDRIKDIGKDLKTGAWLAITVVGGIWFANKASSKLDKLQNDADQKKLVEQQ